MHTYDLADENAYATEGDDLNWLTGIDTKHRAVFDHAPHILDSMRETNKGLGTSGLTRDGMR